MPRIFNLRPSLTPDQHAARTEGWRDSARQRETRRSRGRRLAFVGSGRNRLQLFYHSRQAYAQEATELHAVLPPSLNIVTLKEFLEIFDTYEAGKAM